MERINNGWLFTRNFDSGFSSSLPVRIPHNVSPLPLHHASPRHYEMVSGYKRILSLTGEDLGKRLFLQFDGAAHIAYVYVNGKEAGSHRCGYTSFRIEITDFVHEGDNEILVRLDSTENPSIPPFGFVIDYLTYGGIYRDVWLDRRPATFISDIFVMTPTTSSLKASVKLDGEEKGSLLRYVLRDSDGNMIQSETTDALEVSWKDLEVDEWNIDSPVMYSMEVTLLDFGKEKDTLSTPFGFRTVRFDSSSFYLNGKKLFLRGLNRHQSYPYIGYAAPERMQREDARFLRFTLGCNAVRTSHYPQSRYFIDECDKIGLLVFTEIPGWQHIGDNEWQESAKENTREMVAQYRNHPSVFLWGVRINESTDCDALYRDTNAIAHALDPSRPTSGVRYIEKSSLLEDVYAYNDFSHYGTNSGCRRKRNVTPDMSRPLIISESNGHMFPTKAFDNSRRREEQALRHARVLDDAMKGGEHAGVFQWCMSDYPTHKDFGSGDRICYHGVSDAFRNPKTAGLFYSSQSDGKQVLEISSTMDIGDYDKGMRGKVWLFTNASSVLLKKNGKTIATLLSSASPYSSLPHPPIPLSDTIGDLLEKEEGMDRKKAALVKDCLNAAAEHGLGNLPLRYIARLGWCMLRYGLSFDEGVRLYGKYVTSWGGESTVWEMVGIWNGKEGRKIVLSPSDSVHLEIEDHPSLLREDGTYDATLMKITVRDEWGNISPYSLIPLELEADGAVEIMGPSLVVAEGGMCGTIVRTRGMAGKGYVTISSPGLESVRAEFDVNVEE